MAKFTVTHEIEVDTGDIPSPAIAEYLTRAASDESDWNVWELASHGSSRLVSIEPTG